MSEEVMENGVSEPVEQASEQEVFESADDIAAWLDRADGTEDADGEQPEEQPAAEEAQTEEPAVDDGYLPEGWNAEQWGGVSEAARAVIRAREQAHADAMAAKVREYQELQAAQADAQAKADAEMRNSLMLMRSITEAEYAGVDWETLKRTDPQAFVDLQDRYSKRVGAIQQIQQAINARAEQTRQAQEKTRNDELVREMNAALPVLKGLIGEGFDAGKVGAELREYMDKRGIPAEAVNGLSKAYELEMVAKAMLYDRGIEARKAAEAKLAAAPKVSAPTAQQSDSNAEYKRLRANFQRNPNSTEALAELLGAI